MLLQQHKHHEGSQLFWEKLVLLAERSIAILHVISEDFLNHWLTIGIVEP